MSADLQDNQFGRNRPYGFPRTEQSNIGYHPNNNSYHPNPQKLQHDYHNLMQEIDYLKHQFLGDHMEALREEGYIVK